MKKITFTTILIATSILANAEIVAPGVELISHKTWTTGNASGHIEDSKVFFSLANANAFVNSVYGKVYQNIHTNGSHSFSIQNTSEEEKQYNVLMKLCANNNNCINDSRTYNINSKGIFFSSATTYLTTSFSKPGVYNLTASTFISGDTSSSDISNASIIISK